MCNNVEYFLADAHLQSCRATSAMTPTRHLRPRGSNTRLLGGVARASARVPTKVKDTRHSKVKVKVTSTKGQGPGFSRKSICACRRLWLNTDRKGFTLLRPLCLSYMLVSLVCLFVCLSLSNSFCSVFRAVCLSICLSICF